jgi:hypothetical protein
VFFVDVKLTVFAGAADEFLRKYRSGRGAREGIPAIRSNRILSWLTF